MWLTARVSFAAQRSSQDRCAVVVTGERAVVVLADGAGGTTRGAEAAQAAVEFILRELTHGTDFNDPRVLVETLASLDARLAREGGETTAVIATVWPNSIAGASVGDSDAYIFGPSGVVHLTAGQIRKPLLGSGRATPRPFAFAGMLAGTLVVGSDGLFAHAAHGEIADAAMESNLASAAQRLADAARLPSGTYSDDVTIALVRAR